MKLALSEVPALVLWIACSSNSAVAQGYVVYTVAGGAPAPTPAPAIASSINSPSGVAVDSSGNIYISGYNAVYKTDRAGVLTRVAGTARPGFSGDGGSALNAQLHSPQGVAIDSAGNVYIPDLSNGRIRKVSIGGIISTVAGSTQSSGFSGDGGPAIDAVIAGPNGVAVDNAGNLYIADSVNLRIREVTTDGVIQTIAGNGAQGYSGDGGPAIQASLGTYLSGLCVDAAGNIYLSTNGTGSNRVRKISPTGIITTVAGAGPSGTTGVGGSAVNAQLYSPMGVAVDPGGNVFIADGVRILEVSTSGTLTSIAGTDKPGYSGDGGSATSALFQSAISVAVDNDGNVYVADFGNERVRRISANGTITTIAGNGSASYSGDGGPAILAQMNLPFAVASDSSGAFYTADYANHRVRRTSSDGIISTVAGGGAATIVLDGVPATSVALGRISGVAVSEAGEIFVSDSDNFCVWKVGVNGNISRYAGSLFRGFGGDGGLAVNAQLRVPWGLALDSADSLYIADEIDNRVRKVSSNGIISTLAGNGVASYSGDGGPAASAGLNFPQSIAVDTLGNAYITDRNNSRVRMVSPAGVITTVAGSGSVALPSGIVVDGSGNLFVSDGAHIFKLTNGTATIIAGYLIDVYTRDGGPALSAGLGPLGLALGNGGAIYEADQFNAIRVIQPPAPLAVENAASGASGAVAPGEIVTLYGSGLGPAQLVSATTGADGLYDSQLAGTTVTVNGIPAPILYTAASQVAAIVPYETTGGFAYIVATYRERAAAVFSFPIVAAIPGLFTLNASGTGQAATLNQDQSINSASSPASPGDVISLFETGEGQTSPFGIDGMPAITPPPAPILPISVTIGGQTAKVIYAGGAPGEVAGLMQINVQVPSGVQTGNAVPVLVKVGGVSSQGGVTIAVR
jgi:uncharacterized protein (TIGR03437 family)